MGHCGWQIAAQLHYTPCPISWASNDYLFFWPFHCSSQFRELLDIVGISHSQFGPSWTVLYSISRFIYKQRHVGTLVTNNSRSSSPVLLYCGWLPNTSALHNTLINTCKSLMGHNEWLLETQAGASTDTVLSGLSTTRLRVYKAFKRLHFLGITWKVGNSIV